MSGLIDLHCHFVAGIDDGAHSPEEGIEMLQKLKEIGFDRVIATPHMRPGLWDNRREDLLAAYERMLPSLEGQSGLPEVGLSSEHYFDDVVFERILRGEAVPYPGNKAVLLEFYQIDFPYSIDRGLAKIRQAGMVPVLAPPERYRAIWNDLEIVERLIDVGAVCLLDTAALIGKYGKKAQQASLELLEREQYFAACSDAHRPSDVAQVLEAMTLIESKYGRDEIESLFRDGPERILDGTARS